MDIKKLVIENKLPSAVLFLVVLMDLTFVAQHYTAAAAFTAISVIAVLAMMVNELRKD